MTSQHGLAMLQAASLALAQSPTKTATTGSSPISVPSPQCHILKQQEENESSLSHGQALVSQSSTTSQQASNSSSTPSSLSALLNPAPPGQTPPPHGFVLGKDGKLKKKRGRKPTPGLTDEDRRQARLLKNRRTAETSRRRKLALLNQLTQERDEAVELAERLKMRNSQLVKRLAAALGTSEADVEREEVGSDVSRTCSVVDSDSDCTKTKV